MSRGISREMDVNGRVTIPKEMREELRFQKLLDPDHPDKDSATLELNMYMVDDKLIVERKNPSCAFCGSEENITVKYRKKYLCKFCLDEINKNNS